MIRIPNVYRSGLLILTLSASFGAAPAQAQELSKTSVNPPKQTQGYIWDFENGLQDWHASGSAFSDQPVAGANIRTERVNIVKLGGDYWQGLPYPVGQNGNNLIFTADPSEGTLTSSDF